MKQAKAFGEMSRMELQTAIDKVGVMYDYYSCDKQFLKANEGIVKGLVETSVTTANAYEIGTRSTELLMRCDKGPCNHPLVVLISNPTVIVAG